MRQNCFLGHLYQFIISLAMNENRGVFCSSLSKLLSNMSARCYGDFITIICSGCMKLDCSGVL